MRRWALLLALALAGCSTVSPSFGALVPPAASPAPTLPTTSLTAPDGSEMACAGVGLTDVLRGDPANPRLAWLESFPNGGHRLEIVWPPGYSARFTPRLQVLDPTGQVVIEDGDFVEGACVWSDGAHLMYPPFLGFRLDCGPMDVIECASGGRLFQIAKANNWPARRLAELHFTSADGRYRLVFADGTVATGMSSEP